jgi:hypothetical protein
VSFRASQIVFVDQKTYLDKTNVEREDIMLHQQEQGHDELMLLLLQEAVAI